MRGVAYDGSMTDLAVLRRHLDADPVHEPEPGDRAAAVLALLVERPEPAVLFIQRTDEMSRHAGEVAFPGGLRDPDDDSLEATALREAQEELGLDPAAVRILGALDPIHTYVSAILVTPFVGTIDALPALTPSAAEIARAFTVPVATLDRVEERRVLHVDEGGTFHGWWYETGDATIWGATGFMLHALLELLREVRPWASG
jgi:8-oxo-dGTP pyrophosphatase MutT (NUDIX family)